MSKKTYRLLVLLLLVYIVMNQLLIGGYEKQLEKMLKANTELMQGCSKLSEGEDLNETYF